MEASTTIIRPMIRLAPDAILLVFYDPFYSTVPEYGVVEHVDGLSRAIELDGMR